MREAVSFCRICLAQCGTTVTIDDAGIPVAVRGDKANALTAGFACSKGVDGAAMHSRKDRILKPLKRMPDGSFSQISLDQAAAEIAEKLSALIAREGPEAVALYSGTASYFNTTLTKLLPAFTQAIGTPNRFTPLTIDASSMVVRMARMGMWGAGRQRFDTSDVWMMFGINPLISPRSNGVPPFNPTKKFKAAKDRGMHVIVVDPRRTETARYADQFLQVRPGADAAIASAMLRIIIDEGLHDQAFCDAYVDGLDRLRAAIEPFTPEHAATLAGIAAEDIRTAARAFAGPGKRGCADPGTGITMALFSNVSDHMIELLNVVCGRMARAGEAFTNPVPLAPAKPVYAEVSRPPRWWENGHKMRAGGYGMIWTDDGGELPTAALPDEILLPGKGQIRALLSVGGNPGVAFPDQHRTMQALKSLELLVSIEPIMTPTARLAHYIIPPKLMYERTDIPILFGQGTRVPIPFSQYTAPVVSPPEDSDVAEEWHFIWDLARRMGLQLIVAGKPLDMEQAPTSDDILDLVTTGSQVSLEEVRRHPHGKLFEMEQTILPARPEATARFDVMPDDVAEELERYHAHMLAAEQSPYRLTVRRMRQTMNSLISDPAQLDPKKRFNPAYMHPDDLAALGVASGSRIEIASDAGTLVATVEHDDSVRPGTVSMSHMWGGLPDEPADPYGAACTSLLVGMKGCEPINAMPRMTNIPVRIRAVEREAQPAN